MPFPVFGLRCCNIVLLVNQLLDSLLCLSLCRHEGNVQATKACRRVSSNFEVSLLDFSGIRTAPSDLPVVLFNLSLRLPLLVKS